MSDVDIRPRVGITIGDAAGIGPEISIKAVANPQVREQIRCILIGDLAALNRTSSSLSLGSKVAFVPMGDQAIDCVEVFDLGNLPEQFQIGVDAAVTGRASAQNIESSVELWKSGEIDAICTAPISKKAISLGGHHFPGHTEFLAKLTDTERFRMSFFAGSLRVVLLSTHVSLLKAIELVRKPALIELIEFTDREMAKLLGRDVSIAVAGLNPHASEGGMFGDEERLEIWPAIEQCRTSGIDVSGPFSPDTIFLRGHRGDFDAVIALYHDQATIPVKSLSFGSGVNVTLGLPVIRTSVDHGTAYDIAGKGIADSSSMLAAIKLAGELANGSHSKL
jgi:4-hydroxythreonine-4-phosphate dehydrogenase